jgi:hypothetical protein
MSGVQLHDMRDQHHFGDHLHAQRVPETHPQEGACDGFNGFGIVLGPFAAKLCACVSVGGIVRIASYGGIEANPRKGFNWQQARNNVSHCGCHFARSRTVDVHQDALASDAEKKLIRQHYPSSSSRVSVQAPIVNYLVWRRSASLVLFCTLSVSCVLALISIHRINANEIEFWTKSRFDANYEKWRGDQVDRLPDVSCGNLDADFDAWLSALVDKLSGTPAEVAVQLYVMRDNPAKSCADIITRGTLCNKDTVDEALGQHVFQYRFCLNPEFCNLPVEYVCPKACKRSFKEPDTCKDTRELHESLSYLAFTVGFYKSIVYKLLHEGTKIKVLEAWVHLAIQLVALSALIGSMHLWPEWPKSRARMWRVALALFAAPFLASFFPTRLFVSMDEIDDNIHDFVITSRQHYDVHSKLNEVIPAITDVCNRPATDLRNTFNEEVKSMMDSLCAEVGEVSSIIPDRMLFWKAPLPGLRNGCNNLRGAGDNVEKNIRAIQQVCRGLEETFDRVARGSDGKHEEIYRYVDEAIRLARDAGLSIYGVKCAFESFIVLWPLAASCIPGLLEGAAMVKRMSPEASVPGLFLLSLPFVYTPMVWPFYNIAVEFSGNAWLLIAVVFVSAYPLVLAIIGIRGHITAPMIEEDVRNVFDQTRRIQRVMLLVAGLALVCFIVTAATAIRDRFKDTVDHTVVDAATEQIYEVVLGEFTKPWKGLLLLCSVTINYFVKKYIIKITASDWFVKETAEDRMFETMAENLQDLAAWLNNNNMEASMVGHLNKRREEHLDGLLDLNRGGNSGRRLMTQRSSP